MTSWRYISLLLLLRLFAAQPANAQVTAEQAIANTQRLVSIAKCQAAAANDEITVCGVETSRYRLPLPVEPSVGHRVPGDSPRPSVDVALNRECGVHQGQRWCGLHDLREYGYGGGSVPIRVLIMFGKKIVDPDSEFGPPGGYPVSPNRGE